MTLVGKERTQTEGYCNRYTKEGTRFIHITKTRNAARATATVRDTNESDAEGSDFKHEEQKYDDVQPSEVHGSCNTMMVNVGIKDLCPGDVLTQMIMNKQKQVKYLPLAFATQVDPKV